MFNAEHPLQVCKQSHLWRKREISPKIARCFRSNDYLGLANHPKVIAAFKAGLDEYGVGSRGSAVLGGYSKAHQELENALAAFIEYPRALLFSSGYMANVSIITTLAKQLNIQEIYSDRLNHASIYDGILLSQVKFKRFNHRDYDQLNRLLTQSRQSKKMIITEGVFGVDGDRADLTILKDIAKHHQALLILDDAHGFGVIGKQGRGSLEHHHLSYQDIPLMMGTFGKAVGTSGAFVVGTEELIELLIQYARPYIFTTAMPPALAMSTLESLALLQTEHWRRSYLQKLITTFRHEAEKMGLPLLSSNTPIQLILTKDPNITLECFEYLKEKGIWVGALRPPTVPEQGCRLRINLSVSHQEQDIHALLGALDGMRQWIKKS